MIALVALVIGWGSFGNPASTQAAGTLAQFEVEDGVSEEDAALVAEGIRFAQDFFLGEVGATIDRSVNVTIKAGTESIGSDVIAYSTGPSIVILTGSPGWWSTPPAEKLATVVHEYTHFYQYLMLGHGAGESISWVDEGVAEYVSYTALSDVGILDAGSIESHNVHLLRSTDIDSSLAELEASGSTYGISGPDYVVSHLAMARLLDDIGFEAIHTFYSLVADDVEFDSAFLTAFGIAPELYAQGFDTWLESAPGSVVGPADFDVRRGESLESPVRLVAAPTVVEFDGQILIVARTVRASTCELGVRYGKGPHDPLERITFADGDGDVFWLLTLPETPRAGSVHFSIGCGADDIRWTARAS